MKKGQTNVAVYFRIFEILLLVVVISTIAMQVSNIKNGGIYQKKFLSKDLALVLDSVTNARGNLLYVYNPIISNLQNFMVDFSNNAVTVDDQSWAYAVNNNLRFSVPPKDKFGYIALKKTGNSLSVERGGPSDINGFLFECEPAQISTGTIIIDPGHSYSQGDEGFLGGLKDAQGKQIPESALMLLTGVALDAQLNANNKVIGTRALKADYINNVLSQDAKTMPERLAVIKANPDALIISLHAGKQPVSKNIVKAFVNKDSTPEARRLACSLLNSIADKYKMQITGNAVIPVDLAQIGAEDPKQILVNNRDAVLIELGNIDYPNNALLGKPVDLSQAIFAGIALARMK